MLLTVRFQININRLELLQKTNFGIKDVRQLLYLIKYSAPHSLGIATRKMTSFCKVN